MTHAAKTAKDAIDSLIRKARVHLYKPIQIAEILWRDRTVGDINLLDKESYRTKSRKWRDKVCLDFLGRTSSSSARYQDDVFNDNAIPPVILDMLGQINRATDGGVEAYIYNQFENRFSQMSSGLNYCDTHDTSDFRIEEFLNLFWSEPGLRRSIDKIYEIIVYSLFSSLVSALDVTINITSAPDKIGILEDFEDFSRMVIGLAPDTPEITVKARINRVGVTNAADRGLDMWSNFGMAIQVKHLSLSEELAEDIVSSVSSDRIVIVCKDSEQRVIYSLLSQIGWQSRIHSIVTESDLVRWYDKALRGQYADEVGQMVLDRLRAEIMVEFPATNSSEFNEFFFNRGYAYIDINRIWD